MELEMGISLNNLTLCFIPKLFFSLNFSHLFYEISIRVPKKFDMHFVDYVFDFCSHHQKGKRNRRVLVVRDEWVNSLVIKQRKTIFSFQAHRHISKKILLQVGFWTTAAVKRVVIVLLVEGLTVSL